MASTPGTLDDLQSTVLQKTIAEVDELRTTTNGTDQPADFCCVICLDVVSETCEAHPCGHKHFDYLCLLSWLEQQPRCPLCKSVVREVAYGFTEAAGDVAKLRIYTVPPPKAPANNQAQASASNANRANRRRRQWAPRSTPTQDDAITRRRNVYRLQMYSLHVGSNRRTARYRSHRDLTPQLFESDTELVSRARAWLRRELQVFEFLQTPVASTAQSSGDAMTRRRANNAEFLLEYIIAILKTVDMQGSQGQAEGMLTDFLGRDNARLLLHELRSFLKSSSSIEAWDREVQYPPQQRKRPHSDADERPRTADTYRPSYGASHSRARISEATRRYQPD